MVQQQEKKPDRPDWVRDLGLLAVIVSEITAATGVGLGIGYFLWNRQGWPWWVLLLGGILGLALAMFRVYRMSR